MWWQQLIKILKIGRLTRKTPTKHLQQRRPKLRYVFNAKHPPDLFPGGVYISTITYLAARSVPPSHHGPLANMSQIPSDIELQGLSQEAVTASRLEHGSNRMYVQPPRHWWHILGEVLTEPLVLLLLAACVLYFALGDVVEGWFMAGAILFVVLMDVVQDVRAEKAIETLRELSQPRVTVVRDGVAVDIPVEEVVVGDVLSISEGQRIAADASLLQQHDLSVDESILTGESMPVSKHLSDSPMLFQGTMVSAGSGLARATAVGAQTELGKLGRSLEALESEPTLLKRKIDRFVRQMMLAGLLAFLVVLGVNMAYGYPFWSALLFSLAFAMALIPEEIPVAFSTFMALGAYRMTRLSVLVKQPRTVESLGTATVVCLDKTGTMTENRMEVADTIDYTGRGAVLASARWASEPVPFDAMEQAICAAWEQSVPQALRLTRPMAHEYPLEGAPPMMTHVYAAAAGGYEVMAKGGVERILRVCAVDEAIRSKALDDTVRMASNGWRVLGVCRAVWPVDHPLPEHQDDFPFVFEGLLALYDPPKGNIQDVIDGFYRAGVDVKMITGDHPETARYIAHKSGIRDADAVVTGEQLQDMDGDQLREAASRYHVFARMFPEAKLRLVQALKASGAIVAMTGDGVNDGPALKAAQVGVAMGKRGSETARSAASMVLLDDDLTHMVAAIQTGRRIYDNLRKAIRYILSIHLPIVLVVLLPLMLGWEYLHMFTPVHVIFLELIMGPTCAIAFENEPGEPGGSSAPPDTSGQHLFSTRELMVSVVQGLAITVGLLLMYRWGVQQGASEAEVRTYVFVTLLVANIALTLVNRSFRHTLCVTLTYRNPIIWYIIGVTVLITSLILLLPALRAVFELAALTWTSLGWCALTGVVSVLWFEGWKWYNSRGAECVGR